MDGIKRIRMLADIVHKIADYLGRWPAIALDDWSALHPGGRRWGEVVRFNFANHQPDHAIPGQSVLSSAEEAFTTQLEANDLRPVIQVEDELANVKLSMAHERDRTERRIILAQMARIDAVPAHTS